MKDLNALKSELNEVSYKIIEKFCKKHDVVFSSPVIDGELYSHLIFDNEIVIDLIDVITDLELDLPDSDKHLTEWWFSEHERFTSYSFYLKAIKNNEEIEKVSRIIPIKSNSNIKDSPF